MPEVLITRLAHGEGLPLPARATGGSAGFDIASAEDGVLQPMERRIKRPLRNRHRLARDLLDPFGNGPAVLRAGGDCLEDQEVEGALRQVEPGLVGHIAPLVLLQHQDRAVL